MLWGVGDSEHLSSRGTGFILDGPAVGANLREHPGVKLTYRMNLSTYNPTEGLWKKIGFVLDYLMKTEGPLASVFEGMAFLWMLPDLSLPDIQLHFLPIGFYKPEDCDDNFVPLPYPSVSILMRKSHPLSKGYIHLASSDPNEAPLIEPRML